ncbi:MAG: crotonase/enoyl-CoA hydratase family protein [Solirubrobacterales bacterium]|nr:crotonase/enoyl-CoA hydratase family protein [Solirubrobacterales bacterium]
MSELETMTYERDGRIARITLDRPARGNGITFAMPDELAACVERANLDSGVHVIALAGNGSGFCGGYDLVDSAESMGGTGAEPGRGSDVPAGSPLDPATVATNHDPDGTWDPVVDYQMMSRNLRGFMSLFHSDKPAICKVHGYCVAGGTDMALCCDLIVAEDRAKIGYPPARVWGVPTSMLWAHRVGLERARRLLLTGDSIDGTTAVEWGLASGSAPRAELDECFDELLERVARLPVNQLVMHKLAINQALYAQGLQATQTLSVFFDGIARHTPEGFDFQRRAAASGYREAVRERDEPFGDHGLSDGGAPSEPGV